MLLVEDARHEDGAQRDEEQDDNREAQADARVRRVDRHEPVPATQNPSRATHAAAVETAGPPTRPTVEPMCVREHESRPHHMSPCHLLM